MRTRYQAFLMVLILTLLAVGLVRAQGPPPDQGGPPYQGRPQDQGGPEPGVARVSLMDGSVSTQRAGSSDWLAATPNAIVGRGDSLSTGERSRAELELDYANILRLDERTQANVADLTRDRIQVQVAGGQVSYTVFKGSQSDVEIDTPNMAIRPTGEGVYRIQVISPTETALIVRAGGAEVSTPQGSTDVKQGEMIQVQGSDDPQFQVVAAPGGDNWDEWNQGRDREIYNAQSWSHTNRRYTGTEDLDRYGRWKNEPGYGDVWQPSQEGGDWAPYRDGRWVWDPNYGWTWVSEEPWGWAPYHYGRWFQDDDGWAWWPGPVYPSYYPVWSPAYVNFFGFGGRGGFGFGFGSIGWLPVGPCDPFFPWWGGVGFGFGFGGGFGGFGGFGRFGGPRFANITNINNINGGRTIGPLAGRGMPRISNLQGLNQGNARLRAGVSTMAANQFGNGRVPMHQQPISAASLRQGQALTGGLPAAPSRGSLNFTNRGASPGSIPSRSPSSQRFFATRQPPAGPQSFSRQQAGIQNVMHNPGSTFSTGNAAGNRGFTATAGAAGTARAGTPMAGNAGRGATGFPSAGSRGSVGAASNLQTRGGVNSGRPAGSTANWRQFSQSAPSSGRTSTGPAAFGGNGPGARTFGGQSAPASMPRSGASSAAPSGGQGGWRQFSTTSGASRSSGGTSSGSRFSGGQPPSSLGSPRSSGGGNWQRFSTQPAPRSGGNGGSYGRQQLDLHKSITGAPRNSSGGGSSYGGGSSNSPRGSYNSGGGYGGSRGGSYSGGGAYSSPRSYSSGGGYGGPRGGGYSSSPRSAYGGGAYSSPRSYSSGGGYGGGSRGGGGYGGSSRSSYSGGSHGGGGGGGGSRGSSGGGGGHSSGGHSKH